MIPDALYVEPNSVYKRLGLDCWDEKRDARTYRGPGPIIAHPPCARWGAMFWADGSESPGDDGGHFAFAVEALKRWGGVIEHPAKSFAWARYGFADPVSGAWSRDITGVWGTEICQFSYGHRAEKRTWLAAFGPGSPPKMNWSEPDPGACLTPVQNMGKRERLATPLAMARALVDVAIAMAGSGED